MLVIDSHQHFWCNPDPREYIWMREEHKQIMTSFLPDQLYRELTKNKVDYCVTIQAAITEKEAKFILGLSEKYDFIAGAVIWLNMEKKNFSEILKKYKKHSGFLGIRPMIAMEQDPAWMLKKQVKRSFQILAEQDVPVDFLIFQKHMPYLLDLYREFPNLRGVIDHLGHPPIASGNLERWAELIKPFSQFDSLYCKLSGMISLASKNNWKAEDLAPYVRYVFDIFGPERLMFGSDWPPCLLYGSYTDMFNALKTNLKFLKEKDQEKILGLNAKVFYKI